MTESKLNPRTRTTEFGGVLGSLAIVFGLAAVIEFLYFGCNDEGCATPLSVNDWRAIWLRLKDTKLVSWQAFYAYSYWIGALALAERYISGKKVKGTKLRDGNTLMYNFNGRKVMAILAVALGARWYLSDGAMPELVFVYDHYIELANVSMIYAVVISVWLYVRSFTQQNGKDRLLALGGNTGNPIYDWFIGRELNPRVGQFDVKTFLEMRPGLLLWAVINLAMAHHQFLKFGKVSDSMTLVCCFQIYYVIEGIWWEQGIVAMMDITHDGLGYMLVFGDISLVPFTYCLQTRFLADHPVPLGPIKSLAILAVYFFGMWVFRSSNTEKARFKEDHPATKHLGYISTPSGSKLLTSGWWGTARHINYTGDWVMSIAYSLPCGAVFLTYYYLFYFAGLLVHREGRDEHKCAEKYGATWTEYKQRVKYRFVPGVW